MSKHYVQQYALICHILCYDLCLDSVQQHLNEVVDRQTCQLLLPCVSLILSCQLSSPGYVCASYIPRSYQNQRVDFRHSLSNVC